MVRKSLFRGLALGLMSALLVSGAVACSHHHDEGKEVPVTMDQLPAAVAATLQRESAGGQLKEIEKEMKKGKTVYSADIVKDGKQWDISVAEDGTVLSKELEK